MSGKISVGPFSRDVPAYAGKGGRVRARREVHGRPGGGGGVGSAAAERPGRLPAQERAPEACWGTLGLVSRSMLPEILISIRAIILSKSHR